MVRKTINIQAKVNDQLISLIDKKHVRCFGSYNLLRSKELKEFRDPEKAKKIPYYLITNENNRNTSRGILSYSLSYLIKKKTYLLRLGKFQGGS